MAAEIAVNLEALVGLILTVSIASERLVEIIKGNFLWLNEKQSDPKDEGRRRAALQFLAVASGVITAFLVEPILTPSLSNLTSHASSVLAIGLLASGGSGFWNAILSYLLQMKEQKKLEVKAARLESIKPLADVFSNPEIGDEQMTSNECYDVGEK